MIHSFNNRFSDIRWDGEKIVIMGDVIIDPPYEERSCRGNEKSVSHIMKIVSMQCRWNYVVSVTPFICCLVFHNLSLLKSCLACYLQVLKTRAGFYESQLTLTGFVQVMENLESHGIL